MTCRDSRRLLAAYVDGELDGLRRLRVAAHVDGCAGCASEVQAVRDLGGLLRAASARRAVREPRPDLSGLAAGVLSRIGAEDAQSVRARFARLFEDWHWVAVGSGAFSAAFLTIVTVLALLYTPVTEARQMNQRVGTLYVMAVPEDGTGEPVMLEVERTLGSPARDHRYAVPATFGWRAEQVLVAALDKSLMRHGGGVGFRDLSPEEREEVTSLLNEIARMRQTILRTRPGTVTHVSGMHLYISDVVTASGL